MRVSKIFFLKILLVYFAPVLFLNSCLSFQYKKIDLIISTENNINLDINGVPSPTLVHIFELSDIKQFNKVDFWALHDDSDGSLAGELAQKNKWVLRPNKTYKFPILTERKNKYLGVAVEFRHLDGAKWRLVIPIKRRRIRLKLEGNQLQRVK